MSGIDRENLDKLINLLDQAAKVASTIPSFFVPVKKDINGSLKTSDGEIPKLLTEQLAMKDALDLLSKAAIEQKLKLPTVAELLTPNIKGRSGSISNLTRSVRTSRSRAATVSLAHPRGFNREKIEIGSASENVMKILKGLKSKLYELDDIEHISYVIDLVGSNELYRPNINLLNSTDVDSEIQRWLASDYSLTTTEKSLITQCFKSNTIMKSMSSDQLLPTSLQDEEFLDHISKIDEWEFDVFRIHELTNGRPLYFVGYAIFKKLDLISRWKIDHTKLLNFLNNIEAGYNSTNSYHNSTHAADVTQTMYYFLFTAGGSEYLTDIEILASIIAAIIHDYDHPGLNNLFHIKTESPKAILYNDRSVLENYHCAAAFALIKQEENSIFSGLSAEEKHEVRDLIINMVLATDMAQHFDILGQFKLKSSGKGIDKTKKEDRVSVLKMLIKCADISNPTKKPSLAMKWAKQVMEEFFSQGEKERELSLPISPFMDRQNSSVSKCQIGFADFIVTPLFQSFITLLPKLSFVQGILDQNRALWEAQD